MTGTKRLAVWSSGREDFKEKDALLLPNRFKSLQPIHHYRYPILAAGRSAFAKARADPLACNINNEMVLLWNDVTIEDGAGDFTFAGRNESNESREAVVRSCTLLSGKPLKDASIEEVLDDLEAVASRHNKDVEDSDRDHGLQKVTTFSDVNPNLAIAASYSTFMETEVLSSSTAINRDILQRKDDNTQSDAPLDFQPLGCSAVKSKDPIDPQYFTGSGENRLRRDSYLLGPSDVYPDSRHRESELISNNINDVNADKCRNVIGNDHSNLNSSRLDSGLYDYSGDYSSLHSHSYNHQTANIENRRYFEVSERSSNGNIGTNEALNITEGDSDVFDEPSSICGSSFPPNRFKYYSKAQEDQEDPVSYKLLPKVASPSIHDLPVIDVQTTIVECHNPECRKTSSLDVARYFFKNCHNCLVHYCGRKCRKDDWKRHKFHICHGSRVNSACKHVIRLCSQDLDVKATISSLARRGYISSGRGCIMLGFPDLSAAQDFLNYGFCSLELNPVYVTLKELKSSKMYGDVLNHLIDMCKRYNPETRFVLNVGVGLKWDRLNLLSSPQMSPSQPLRSQYKNLDSGYGSLPSEYFLSSSSEIKSPSSPHKSTRKISVSFGSDGGYESLNGSINGNATTSQTLCNTTTKLNSADLSPHSLSSSGFMYSDHGGTMLRHKGPIIQRCVCMRLSSLHLSHSRSFTHFDGDFLALQRSNSSRYGPTLILTGVPGSWEDVDSRKKRELCFINMQRKLRHRGVSLRHQFPWLYSDMVKYVTQGEHFPSQIIFPVDTKAKKMFMCVLMPDSEPDMAWTQSSRLLDELDISKECILSSLSKSHSFPSSLHLSHRHRRHSQRLQDNNSIAGYPCIHATTESKCSPVSLQHRQKSVSFSDFPEPHRSFKENYRSEGLYDQQIRVDTHNSIGSDVSPSPFTFDFPSPNASSSPKDSRHQEGRQSLWKEQPQNLTPSSNWSSRSTQNSYLSSLLPSPTRHIPSAEIGQHINFFQMVPEHIRKKGRNGTVFDFGEATIRKVSKTANPRDTHNTQRTQAPSRSFRVHGKGMTNATDLHYNKDSSDKIKDRTDVGYACYAPNSKSHIVNSKENSSWPPNLEAVNKITSQWEAFNLERKRRRANEMSQNPHHQVSNGDDRRPSVRLQQRSPSSGSRQQTPTHSSSQPGKLSTLF